MFTLTRRIASALAKLDLTGLPHSKRLDAIARTFGLSNGETMMSLLKQGEAKSSSTSKSATEPAYKHYAAIADVMQSTEYAASFATESELAAWFQAMTSVIEHQKLLAHSKSAPSELFEAELEHDPSLRYEDWFEQTHALYIVVNGTPTDPEDVDAGITGIHMLAISLSDVHMSMDAIAGAALDDFHESIAIATLDDFDISLYTMSGLEIGETDHQPERADVDYLGRINNEDAPQAVLAHLKK